MHQRKLILDVMAGEWAHGQRTLDPDMDIILRLPCLAGIFIGFGERVYVSRNDQPRSRDSKVPMHSSNKPFASFGTAKTPKPAGDTKAPTSLLEISLTEGSKVFDGHKLVWL